MSSRVTSCHAATVAFRRSSTYFRFSTPLAPATLLAHLIDTIRDRSLEEALLALESVHGYLVACAHSAFALVPPADPAWGVHVKRLEVNMPVAGRPTLVGKEREKLAEVVNMLATLERLLSALRWFSGHAEFRGLRVVVCHPSTSSAASENDLMLAGPDGAVRVRCEVCDVVSRNAGQNGKERTDIANLGPERTGSSGPVRRFICTSPEFAGALASDRRKWSSAEHRYAVHPTADGTNTVLLELVAGQPPQEREERAEIPEMISWRPEET